MEAAEIAGTVVFAVSGVLAVAGRRLDWFGAIVVGIVTALGGGTMRGLILGITPVFWIEDQVYLLAALLGGIAAIPLIELLRSTPRGFGRGVVLADAAGLALFAVVGASVALDHGFDAAVAIVCGILTGVGGGVIRDLLAGRTPLIMRGEIYATAALAGTFVFVALDHWAETPEAVASAIGMIVIFGLRMLGVRRDWSLPLIQGP